MITGYFASDRVAVFRRFGTTDTDPGAATCALAGSGHDRTRLTHQDIGSLAPEKTASVLMESYRKARVFVDAVPALSRTCMPNGDDSEADNVTANTDRTLPGR